MKTQLHFEKFKLYKVKGKHGIGSLGVIVAVVIAMVIVSVVVFGVVMVVGLGLSVVLKICFL